jgi:hypothetical protein
MKKHIFRKWHSGQTFTDGEYASIAGVLTFRSKKDGVTPIAICRNTLWGKKILGHDLDINREYINVPFGIISKVGSALLVGKQTSWFPSQWSEIHRGFLPPRMGTYRKRLWDYLDNKPPRYLIWSEDGIPSSMLSLPLITHDTVDWSTWYGTNCYDDAIMAGIMGAEIYDLEKILTNLKTDYYPQLLHLSTV